MTDLTHPAPSLSLAEAQAIARDFFGVEGGISPLASERDQNFRIIVRGESGFVLKIVNASEPQEQSDFQTALLDHLAQHAPGLSVPRLRRARDGQMKLR